MRALLCCVALALAAAGCDSASPEPPVTAPPVVLRSFDLSGLPSQTEIELTDADTIAVLGLFGSSRPAGLSLRITAAGGATATGTSGALVVRAEALGDALVALALTAPGYRDTTATLAVRVVPGICPAPAPAGFADLYPIANGTTARYSYSGSSFYRSSFPTSTDQTGTVTAEIGGVGCFNHRRTFRLIYRYAGTTTTTIVGSPVPPSTVPSEQVFTYTAAEDAANVVTVPLPGLTVGYYNVTVPRYAAQAELTRAAMAPVGDRSCASEVIFRAGVGLARETVPFCYLGFGSSVGQSITLQP